MKKRADTVRLAEEIEAYLVAYPNAADTIEGIIKWWIVLQCYEQMHRDVEEALEYLVNSGVVVKRKLRDGRVIYAKSAK